jgi:acetyl-CoA acetyltransferase
VKSYQRATEANKKGLFKELSPVELKTKDKSGKSIVVSNDEEPAKVDFAKLPKLNPAFVKVFIPPHDNTTL